MHINRHIHYLPAFMRDPSKYNFLPSSTNPANMIIKFIFLNKFKSLYSLMNLGEWHLLTNFILMSYFRVTININIRMQMQSRVPFGIFIILFLYQVSEFINSILLLIVEEMESNCGLVLIYYLCYFFGFLRSKIIM